LYDLQDGVRWGVLRLCTPQPFARTQRAAAREAAARAAAGAFAADLISEEQRSDIVRNACPGAGACGGMYTANTMACAAEALGMTLPYSSSVPAEDPLKLLECRAAGLCAPARPARPWVGLIDTGLPLLACSSCQARQPRAAALARREVALRHVAWRRLVAWLTSGGADVCAYRPPAPVRAGRLWSC